MTNQFTDEQVERATSLADEFERSMTRQEWLPASLGIRAAALLREFAAGVAPQAPSERTPEFESREQELFKHQPVLSMKDAATAAIERVRALETFSITDSYPAWTAVDHDDLLAALDGAPEPEVKP